MFWSGRGDLERKRVRDKRLGGTRVRDKVGQVWLILGGRKNWWDIMKRSD